MNSFINNNQNILIYKKDFYKILTKAEIVISGGTTATVDSYILNKKIILICSSNGLFFNPLINFSKKKVKICYDLQEGFPASRKGADVSDAMHHPVHGLVGAVQFHAEGDSIKCKQLLLRLLKELNKR